MSGEGLGPPGTKTTNPIGKTFIHFCSDLIIQIQSVGRQPLTKESLSSPTSWSPINVQYMLALLVNREVNSTSLFGAKRKIRNVRAINNIATALSQHLEFYLSQDGIHRQELTKQLRPPKEPTLDSGRRKSFGPKTTGHISPFKVSKCQNFSKKKNHW